MDKKDVKPGMTILFKGNPNESWYNRDMVGKTYVVSNLGSMRTDSGRADLINVLGAPKPNEDGGYNINPKYCDLVVTEAFAIF